jgi:hypothetical protein
MAAARGVYQIRLRIWFGARPAEDDFLIDTGASVTFLSRTLAEALRIPFDPARQRAARTASGVMTVYDSEVTVHLKRRVLQLRCWIPVEVEGLNLISIGQLVNDHGFTVGFGPRGVTIRAGRCHPNRK